jgi:hypothetical protein
VKTSKTLLAVAIAALMQLPAVAIPQREQAVVAGIAKVMFERNTVSVRGLKSSVKNGDKALGLYSGNQAIVFRSGYENLPSQTQVEWAYDLHEFVVSKGGGLANYDRYVLEQEERKKLPQIPEYGVAGKEPDPYDPLDREYVSYAERKKFAREWWEVRDEGFKHCVMPDWWLNDAILDGTNLWQRWESTYRSSADTAMMRMAELTALVKQE